MILTNSKEAMQKAYKCEESTYSYILGDSNIGGGSMGAVEVHGCIAPVEFMHYDVSCSVVIVLYMYSCSTACEYVLCGWRFPGSTLGSATISLSTSSAYDSEERGLGEFN